MTDTEGAERAEAPRSVRTDSDFGVRAGRARLVLAGRRAGALAVAGFCALVSGSFLPGMHVSMLVSAAVLALGTVAVFVVFRRR